MSRKKLIIEGPNTLRNILRLLAVISFFLFFFISFLKVHVYNYDFWWHLATGKYIVENRSLPQSDPFSYTSHQEPTTKKSMILKGYWLSQAIFYKVYSQWDLKGIIILRSLLLLGYLLLIFLAVRKQGPPDWLALLLVTGVFFLAANFTGERPQLFTFLFFAIIMYLLEDFRKTRSKKILFIPLAILLLSNMHPGYIVCILLLSLYILGEGVLLVMRRGPVDKGFKLLSSVWISALILSFLNPNGFSVFGEMLTLGEQTKGIVEFMPTFYAYRNNLSQLHYSYIGFLLLSLLNLRYIRKIGLVHMLVLITFTIMSLASLRYLIFYMCAAAPILARTILYVKEEKYINSYVRGLKSRESLLYGLAFILGAVLVFSEIPAFARYEFRANTALAVPNDAADFLNSQKFYGNMFNEYGFGGYLIWRLYPDKKVFIDGRHLENEVADEYNVIASAYEGKDRNWSELLKKYGITYIVMPPLTVRGDIIPIVEKLLDMNEWVLIYSDHLALVFLKKDDNNMQLVSRFAKDKSDGLQTIIIQAAAKAMKNPNNPYYLISLGKAFFRLNKIDDAEKAFTMAFKIDPGNAEINEYLSKINDQKNKSHISSTEKAEKQLGLLTAGSLHISDIFLSSDMLLLSYLQ